MNLYVLNYNNYYNRIVKRESTLIDYQPFVIYGPVVGVYGFTPSDGVDTIQLLGSAPQSYDGKGDYLLAVEEDGTINSRWFIIEAKRTRQGQWALQLHRDLVVDYFEPIMQSPMYIEKAIVGDDDPAIWNGEGVKVNQIKSAEFVLRDATKSAWIVGYVARDYAGGEIDVKISAPPAFKEMTSEEFTFFLNENNYRYIDEYLFAFKHRYKYQLSTNSQYDFTTTYALSNKTNKWIETSEEFSTLEPTSYSLASPELNILTNVLNFITPAQNREVINIAKMSKTTIETNTEEHAKELLAYNNKIIKVVDGAETHFYKISATKKDAGKAFDYIKSNMSKIDGVDAIPTWLAQRISAGVYNYFEGTPSGVICWKYKGIQLTAEEVFSVDGKFVFSGTRRQLVDMPFDMFCIPYSDNFVYSVGGGAIKSLDKLSAISFAQSLAVAMGTNLIDLQLLPYCPISGWTMEDDVRPGGAEKSVFTIAGENNVDYNQLNIEGRWALVLYSGQSQGSINSEQLHLIDTQTGEELPMPLPLENKKLSNECDIYRLCAPNFNGQFEFTASKMNGITGFNVDFTYLPQTPYIHINPVFGGLYGKDYDDARGLVCQGDFSLAYVSDAWEQYKIQNKNYSNIFNRQIENMETTQDVERKKQVFDAVMGTIQGGISGASAGAIGGAWGAIAGGIVGTIGGAIGGALDVSYGDTLRNEALDYTKDMFNYSLDNIKALPQSLASTTAYTKNNKIFPVLEYYTCTETEKEAIANKIAYNGMTVMRIGQISQFAGNVWNYKQIESKGYIKGKLIRLEGINEDYHVINAIAGELNKGVYISK